MSALDAEKRIMALKNVLLHNNFEFVMPYKYKAQGAEIFKAEIAEIFLLLSHYIKFSFDISISKISETFTPPNKGSVTEFSAQFDAITATKFLFMPTD